MSPAERAGRVQIDHGSGVCVIDDLRVREIAMAMYHPLAARWDGVVTPELLFGGMMNVD